VTFLVRRLMSDGMRTRLHVVRKAGLRFVLTNWIFGLLSRKSSPGFSLHFTSQVTAAEKINYSADQLTLSSFACSGHCYFQANNGIHFGKNCLIAPGVKIISSNHGLTGRKFERGSPIQIGNDVWIGAGAIMLPGSVVGDRCVAGAGSVVTRAFPDEGLVIAGNPAEIIKRLDIDEKAHSLPEPGHRKEQERLSVR